MENIMSITNKKINFKFLIEDTFTAGLVLEGWECKKINQNKANLDNSYIIIRNGEAFCINMLIDSDNINFESTRTRKLLLHKKEISNLDGLVRQKRYTLIPKKIYLSKGKFKIDFCLCKGKTLVDKRISEKEKELDKEKQQILKKNKIKF